jgi:hypothetical protein
MKKTLLVLFLALAAAGRGFAACSEVSGSQWYCSGTPQYVFTGSTGVVAVQMERSDRTTIGSPIILDAAAVGSGRFDQMFTSLMTAAANRLSTYVEYNTSRQITAVSVYNLGSTISSN